MSTTRTPTRPTPRQAVHRLARRWGVRVGHRAVCPGHSAPLDFLTACVHRRDPLLLLLGPRGGGKSYLSALATHVDSIRRRLHGTCILGGSLAQSQQVYTALRDFDRVRPADGVFSSFTKTAAAYRTGSHVTILAASQTSVRGPHVPTLRLDEIDEIDPDIRESAMGMCMARDGVPASVTMTSTWHRLGGPMGGLIERARAPGSGIAHHAFCVFEILERCPESRSGPPTGGPDLYAHCPACPIRKWCHEHVDAAGRPRAKRSAGHYAIDSLIQKVRSVSARVFEADYLCRGPRADGIWFPQFDPATHVRESAEYDPALPVVLAVDSGVFTGAVWLQVRQVGPAGIGGGDPVPVVNVFADYLSEGLSADANARAVLEVGRQYCNGRVARIVTDPAGGARNPVGPTVLAEYERCGLRPLERWPLRPVADGLALVESFVKSADGTIGLTVHPRCKHLVAAFAGYGRARRAGQWQDYPQDPMHPYEDLMDALRGGLVSLFPGGRRPANPQLRGLSPGRLF
jgi:hypothetical protein